MHCYRIKGTGSISVNGGLGGDYAGGGAGGRIAVYFTENRTYTGSFQSRGGASKVEPGGPGTSFMYHMVHTHRTLLVDNGGQRPTYPRIVNYSDLSQDGARAWILPESGSHQFANGSHAFSFEELQIYGGAHLAILTEPVNRKISLFFRFMIGDRTGTVHIGRNQEMDLHRQFLDIPFNAYIYDGATLGLAPVSEINQVSIHVEGALHHVANLTILKGGALHCYLTGSTGSNTDGQFVFNETLRIMADSKVITHSPNANYNRFTLKAKILLVEGGGELKSVSININAVNITVDDGGHITADNGTYCTLLTFTRSSKLQ